MLLVLIVKVVETQPVGAEHEGNLHEAPTLVAPADLDSNHQQSGGDVPLRSVDQSTVAEEVALCTSFVSFCAMF